MHRNLVGPAHNDLMAMVGPGLVHLLHEDQFVLELPEELPNGFRHVLLD